MPKEDEVETAAERLATRLHQHGVNFKVEVKQELDLMFDVGHQQGLVDTDAMLAEALAGLQAGNALAERLKAERDAILEEYARVSWENVVRSMMATGLGRHPPEFHEIAAFAVKHGRVVCKGCEPKLTGWDRLDVAAKKAKMQKVWAAVMQARARRIVDKVPMENMADAPTTHELAGTSRPSPCCICQENKPRPADLKCDCGCHRS